MPYILNKTNGTLLTTVDDATVNNTYSLTFVGKNFTGYGQAIEENFVKLLENFANSTNSAPTNPVAGQLWFNTSTSQLNISPAGIANQWKGIGSITIGSTSTVVNPVDGDMFWDSSLAQLIVYNGQSKSYMNIGPSSTSTNAAWSFGRITSNSGGNPSYPAIVGSLSVTGTGLVPMVVYSNAAVQSYIPDPVLASPYSKFNSIQRGITLQGANTSTIVPPNAILPNIPGSTINSGFYFWGTAAESLATVAVELTPTKKFDNCYIPFAGTYSGATQLVTSSTFSYNPGTGVVNATATAAYYADLAERYEADAEYEVGTVLVIGGTKEVTVTDQFADTRVAGIVSKNPAYMMNSNAGSDETHPYIALKGRVPCKVVGYIAKGDLLVTSAHPGYATAAKSVSAGAVIGKALEANSEGFGVIEVLVV